MWHHCYIRGLYFVCRWHHPSANGDSTAKEIIYFFATASRLQQVTRQGLTLTVFRYLEHPRLSDGIPDSPEPFFAAIWGLDFRANFIILTRMFKQIKQI